MFFSSFAVTIVHIEFEFIEFIEQGQSLKKGSSIPKAQTSLLFSQNFVYFLWFLWCQRERAQPQYGRLMHTALSVYTARLLNFFTQLKVELTMISTVGSSRFS